MSARSEGGSHGIRVAVHTRSLPSRTRWRGGSSFQTYCSWRGPRPAQAEGFHCDSHLGGVDEVQ
eukprot:3158618-Prymnesium_polylepis.1